MSDHLIWKNGINNEFSPTSLTDAVVGSGYVATAIISAVTTKSRFHMSQYDAYLDLFEKLHDGERPAPQNTATELSALTSMYPGTIALDITNSRLTAYISSAWVSAGGTSSGSTVAFGAMYEDNSSGSGISATTAYVGWVTATAGVFDSGALVAFTGNTTADRLTVGTGGAGAYMIEFHVSVKNSGGKLTTAAIHVNGVEQVGIKMSLTGDSSKAVALSSAGILTLADSDYVDLRVKSEASDTVTVFQANVNIDRIEVS